MMFLIKKVDKKFHSSNLVNDTEEDSLSDLLNKICV